MAFSNHDVRPDTPINNFATLNPLANGGTLEEGNLRFKHVGNDAAKSALSTFLLPNSGTYYWEIYEETAIPNNSRVSFGICNSIHASKAAQSEYIIFETDSHGYSDRTNVDNPQFRINGNVVGTFNTDYTINYGSGGVISFYVNMDTNEFTVGRNDAAYKTYSFPRKYNITYSIFFNLFCDGSQTLSQVINFGQDPTFAGNKTPTKVYTDSNGQGRFYYEPPAGALALCSRNIDNPKNVPTTYIVDETNANMLTYNGNTEISTFSPYAADGYSIAFDGTNDHLTVPSSVVNFGLNPFSFEFWYYPMSNNSGSGTYQVFLDARTNGAVKYLFGLKDGRLYYYMGESSTEYFSDSTLGPNYVSPNRWSHILFAQDGANFRIYLNGTRVYTIAKTALYGNDGFVPADTTAFIGESKSGGRVSGHLADIRIRKGVTGEASSAAFYDITGDTITVPSSSFTGNDVTNATFLQSTSSKLIKDTSSSATTISTVGAPSIAAWSPYTSINKQTGFELPETTNGGSFSFDGTGDYLTIPGSADTAFGTGAFTVEFWLYVTDLSANAYHCLMDFRDSSTNGNDTDAFGFFIHGSAATAGNIYIFQGSSITFNQVLKEGEWNHIALVRTGTGSNGLSLYLNGVKGTDATLNTDLSATNTVHIGKYPVNSNFDLYGYMTDIRFVKGKAVYTGNFTPPSGKLGLTQSAGTNISAITSGETKLLLQPFQPKSLVNSPVFNITDSYNKGEANKNLTYVGNTKVVDFSPYKGGSHGSFYFDGTGDYISIPSLNASIGIDNFTIEFWVYLNDTTAGTFFNSTTGLLYQIRASDDAALLQTNLGGTTTNKASGNIQTSNLNKWVHHAIVRNGTDADNVKIYENGIQSGIGTIQESLSFSQCNLAGMTGYMTDFRIVGSAVYTGAFTPPYDELTAITYTKLLLQPGKVADTDNEAAKDSDSFFKSVIWTGDGSNPRNIPIGFNPDFVWIKNRTGTANSHSTFDSVRGFGKKHLWTDLLNGQTTNEFGHVSGVSNNNITVTAGTSDDVYVNNSGTDYVAWCFRAGGAPTATDDGTGVNGSAKLVNTSGTESTTTCKSFKDAAVTAGASNVICPSKMSINQKSGFSIIKYVGAGTTNSRTIPHGLSSTPDLIIIKDLDASSDWITWFQDFGADSYIRLNTTGAKATVTNAWGGSPTNNTFNVYQSGSHNTSGNDYIAYCWHSVPGYSVFGSYIGKGSNPQPFVYIGFRPAFIMIKGVDDNGLNSYQGWSIFDTARDDYNPAVKPLYANASYTEGVAGNGSGTVGGIDLLSNGFRILDGTASYSGIDGIRHIYMAFAELPFSYARGR